MSGHGSPKDEAALLLAAIAAAKDQFGQLSAKPDPCAESDVQPADAVSYSNADALVDVARVFLETAPEDRSGEDRSLVVVQVSAENLARNVPAGTPEARPAGVDPVDNVPAGTSSPESAVCHIDGVNRTSDRAEVGLRHPMLGAVIDKHGRVLALGRTRRLVSKALRRAVMIRDKMCRYPGCHQTRHLDAHHVISWIRGGRADLDNLILLCRWHHTAVHEGGVSITRDGEGWVLTKPDGRRCDPLVDEENLARHLDFALRRRNQELDQLAAVDSFQHPDARTIRPRWAGETFDLHACVQALFTFKLPNPSLDLDQQAA
jgi:hypothetical protein